jgi:hypothetical protein
VPDHGLGQGQVRAEQKQKEARKRQNQISVKEIKMRPKISDNDYGTKSGPRAPVPRGRREGPRLDHVPRP